MIDVQGWSRCDVSAQADAPYSKCRTQYDGRRRCRSALTEAGGTASTWAAETASTGRAEPQTRRVGSVGAKRPTFPQANQSLNSLSSVVGGQCQRHWGNSLSAVPSPAVG